MEIQTRKRKKTIGVQLEYGVVDKLVEIARTMNATRGSIVSALIDTFYEQGFQEFKNTQTSDRKS